MKYIQNNDRNEQKNLIKYENHIHIIIVVKKNNDYLIAY